MAHDASFAGDGGHLASRGDLADGLLVPIGHEDIALRIDRDAHRPCQSRCRTGAVHIARLPGRACECAHHTRRRDLADRVVAEIGDVEIAGRVGRDRERPVESRGRPSPVGTPGNPWRAGESGHNTGLRDLSNRVSEFAHIEVAQLIEGNGHRRIETRHHSGAVRTARQARRAGQRADHTSRRDLADGVVVPVSDVQVARLVRGNALRVREARCRSGAVGASTRTSHACYGGGHPVRRDLANHMLRPIAR